jgi:hypothetical protein
LGLQIRDVLDSKDHHLDIEVPIIPVSEVESDQDEVNDEIERSSTELDCEENEEASEIERNDREDMEDDNCTW